MIVANYKAGEASLNEAEASLDKMAPTFNSVSDQKQLTAARDQIAALRKQLQLKGEEGKELESPMMLRRLGLAQIRCGDVESGRKNLIKSLNQMVMSRVGGDRFPWRCFCLLVGCICGKVLFFSKA